MQSILEVVHRVSEIVMYFTEKEEASKEPFKFNICGRAMAQDWSG